jgi:hypothetical protein
MAIFATSNHQDRTSQVCNVIDWPQVGRGDVQSRAQLEKQERRYRPFKWTDPYTQSIGDRPVDRRIDRFEDRGLYLEGLKEPFREGFNWWPPHSATKPSFPAALPTGRHARL